MSNAATKRESLRERYGDKHISGTLTAVSSKVWQASGGPEGRLKAGDGLGLRNEGS